MKKYLNLFVATVLGSSITVYLTAAPKVIDSSAIPAGAVIAFARTSCPAGYSAADGTTLSRTDEAIAFGAMGTIHGTGNGTTTFNKPDYRGRFLRGVDAGASRDPDAGGRTAMNAGGSVGNNVGSVQASAFASHNHPTSSATYTPKLFGGIGFTTGELNVGSTTFPITTQQIPDQTITIASQGGNETRPLNAYVLYCVKL